MYVQVSMMNGAIGLLELVCTSTNNNDMEIFLSFEHGEAHIQQYDITAINRSGNVQTVWTLVPIHKDPYISGQRGTYGSLPN